MNFTEDPSEIHSLEEFMKEKDPIEIGLIGECVALVKSYQVLKIKWQNLFKYLFWSASRILPTENNSKVFQSNCDTTNLRTAARIDISPDHIMETGVSWYFSWNHKSFHAYYIKIQKIKYWKNM